MNKLVSVLIPVYNSVEVLRQSVKAVLEQTYNQIELIIVDDGSKDSSFDVARKFESARVKVFSQKNRGACAARNLGFERSSGDYILFLDADDIISSNKIEEQVKILNGTKDAVASCKWDKFAEDVQECTFPDRYLDRDWNDPKDWLINAWEGRGMAQTSVWLTPRQLIEKAGPWDERLQVNQDGEFFNRVLLQAREIKFSPVAKVYYRSTGKESVSRILSEQKASSLLLSYQLYKKNTLPHEDSLRFRHALMMNFMDFIYRFNGKYPVLAYQARMEIKGLGFDQLPLVGGRYFQKLAGVIGTENALMLRKTILRY